jgi:hypothetical protein
MMTAEDILRIEKDIVLMPQKYIFFDLFCYLPHQAAG